MREKIIKLRLDGFTYNEISKELNCSKSLISYYCSNIENNKSIVLNNLLRKKDLKKIKFDIDEKVISNIKKQRSYGLSIDEISNILNLEKFIVKKICKKYDLIYLRVLDGDKLKIIDLYKKGDSISSISKKVGISRFTISKYLKLFGLNKLEKNIIKISSKDKVSFWRKNRKEKLVNYKGGKCEICGYSKSLRALQFHHLDPNEKDFSISNSNKNYESLLEKVDKCILLCANCHSEIHDLNLMK